MRAEIPKLVSQQDIKADEAWQSPSDDNQKPAAANGERAMQSNQCN
jgi:hypothetical protein